MTTSLAEPARGAVTGAETSGARRLGRTAGRGLRRFRSAAPEVAAAVLPLVEKEVPGLADLAGRARGDEESLIASTLQRQLDLFDSNSGYEACDLAAFTGFFRSISSLGAPRAMAERWHRAGVAHTSAELWSRADTADVPDLLLLSRWLLRHGGAVEQLLVGVYGAPTGTAGTGSELGEWLLDGVQEATGSDGTSLFASEYLVVVLAEPGSSEWPPTAPPAGALAVTRDRQRHLLVPIDGRRDRARAWRDVGHWVDARSGCQGAAVFAERPGAVPIAAERARAVLRAARAVKVPGALVSRRDLQFEMTMAQQPEALHQITRVLEPLEDDPRLLQTLESLYDHDLDRTRTAEDLQLSRGGLTVRLDRIRARTGLDPRSARGIQILGLALTAQALLGLRGSTARARRTWPPSR